MIGYIDTSVVLRWLLLGDPVFEKLAGIEVRGSSELLLIETSRVLERCRLSQELNDEQLAQLINAFNGFADGISIIPLNDLVKKRAAGSFPTVVGALDALHLSSALAWRDSALDDLEIFSFDKQMNICARALGFPTPLI
jgi:hypothetical protein